MKYDIEDIIIVGAVVSLFLVAIVLILVGVGFTIKYRDCVDFGNETPCDEFVIGEWIDTDYIEYEEMGCLRLVEHCYENDTTLCWHSWETEYYECEEYTP